MSINVLSEIDLLLSNVNVELSSVSFKMSSLPVNLRPKYLPRIGVMLSTIESLVSSSSSSSSSSSGASTCSDLSWDPDHDYYVYSEEEDNTTMNGLNDCVFDLPTSSDECVIHPPTHNDDVDVTSYSEYHCQMSPAAREVSQMFPAAVVSYMFPLANQETMTTEYVTSSMTSASVTPSMSTESLTSSMTSESVTSSITSESMTSSKTLTSSEFMTTSMTSDSNTTVDWTYYYNYQEVEEDLTTKLTKFINIAAPGAVFSIAKSRRRRRKKIIKFVHPELKDIFQHSLILFSSARSTPEAVLRPPVPLVDWSKVNSRMIKNVPDPVPCTVYGVSDDPEFYKDDPKLKTSPYSITCKFHKGQPFGTLLGHKTTCGVIPPGCDQVIHGYTWSQENYGFIIKAQFPSEMKEMGKQTVTTNSNKKFKRKK